MYLCKLRPTVNPKVLSWQAIRPDQAINGDRKSALQDLTVTLSHDRSKVFFHHDVVIV